MATTYTDHLRLGKPAVGDTGWGVTINGDLDTLDTILGGLVVQTHEAPSSSLKIDVSPGPLWLWNGFVWYPGTSGSGGSGSPITLTANATTAIYLENDEMRTAAVANAAVPFPSSTLTTSITPLAVVVTGATTVTSITHWRFAASAFQPYVDGPFADDAAAATFGILVGQLYHDSSGVVRVRLA